MKFSELSTEQIFEISKIYWDRKMRWDERMEALSQYLGKSERTVQSWISKLGITEKSIQESPQLIKAMEKKFNKKKRRFIVSWAQNDTPAHDNFISNIEKYAEHIFLYHYYLKTIPY